MNTRKKNIIVSVLILASAGFIFLWYYPLNKGKVEVSTGLTAYLVFQGSLAVDCPQDPCVLTLKSGPMDLKVQKDGYFPSVVRVNVARFKTVPATVTLKRIPTLVKAEVGPEEEAKAPDLPNQVIALSPMASAWDKEATKVVFWDAGDEKLKYWSQEQGVRVITPLKGMGGDLNLKWAPDGRWVSAITGMDLYWIDSVAASRRKLPLKFAPRHVVWSPDSKFLLVDDSRNSILRIEGGKADALPLKSDLAMGTWWEGKWVYYQTDSKENKTTVSAYDFATGESQEIVSKFNFPVSEVRSDGQGGIFFFNEIEKSWYKLES